MLNPDIPISFLLGKNSVIWHTNKDWLTKSGPKLFYWISYNTEAGELSFFIVYNGLSHEKWLEENSFSKTLRPAIQITSFRGL